ncbi:MAG: GNAT family N-acetyltransferase [Pseudomonadota bacterium]
MDAITLRLSRPDDYDALGALMFDAIHNGPTQYSKAQSQAWAPAPWSGADWAARLDRKHVIVAHEDLALSDFMTVEPGGYIDFAYIRPEAQGTGLFRRLYQAIEEHARQMGETQLSTHGSLMAQPAFAAMGFRTDQHESVERNGQTLARAQMSKSLRDQP